MLAMRAFDVEMSRRGFASALAAGALSLALAGCGGRAAGAGSAAGSVATDGAGAAAEPVEVHVASLKGPTSIGLVQFMDRQPMARQTMSSTLRSTLPPTRSCPR